jgi:predicted nucleic acid-binding protein
MEKNYLVDANTLIYASKDQTGAIALWLQLNRPYASDIVKFECLERWAKINSPEKILERKFLEDFVHSSQENDRYVITRWKDPTNSLRLRAEELQSHGIKERDSYIAATAEKYGLILVTADIADFARRLEKLNQQSLGNFKLQPYAYSTREETFRGWIEAFIKSQMQ